MDGAWTDATVNTQTAERDVNWNVPGDGRFDQSTLPSPVELMMGRVDLSNLTCFSNKSNSRSELDLLRQYLNKDHAFRHGELPVERRGLICDNFADKGDDPIGGSAWRAFPGFFGADNVNEVGWDGFLPAATQGSYLWSYGSGGGSYYYSMGVATSDDFALQDVKVVFAMFMGSYFGDWNNESNYLRAALGSGWVLASSYSGFPHSIYFPMGIGEPIGYSMWLSQNNHTNGLYEPWVQGTSQVHVSLLGDPSLRMFPVKPVANLASLPEPGVARLSWNAPAEANLEGYLIYRSASAAGPFQKITPSPITATTFTDIPLAGTYTYFVRAVKLETSASGTFLNPSQAAFANVTVTGAAPNPPEMPTVSAAAVSYSQIDLQWNDVGTETGYRVQQKIGANGNWTDRASLPSGTTTYSDTALSGSTEYFYRVVAFNADGDSPFSNEAPVTTPVRPPDPPAAPLLQGAAFSQTVIDLRWSDLPNETGYKIERQPGASGAWEEITTLPANAVSFSDQGLAPATSYSYRMLASNNDGNSPYSVVLTLSTKSPPPQPPSAPVLQASPISQSEISLQWNDLSNETGFKLERKAGATGPWIELPALAANATAFLDAELAPATVYYYRIRAFNLEGNSAYSAEVTASTPERPLNPPLAPALQLAGTATTRVDLTWNDVATELGYKLERKTGVAGTWTEFPALAANLSAYADSAVLPSTEYYYRLRAFNADGNSAYSSEVHAATAAPPLNPPTAPTLQLAGATSGRVDLTWNDLPNELGYKLEHRTGAAGAWAEFPIFAANLTAYSDTAVLPSTEYYYRLRAFNADGNSAYSSEVHAATAAPPLNPPTAPTLQLAGVASGRVDLTWIDGANELGYKLERKSGAAGTWTEFPSLAANLSAYSDSAVTPSTEYFYRIRAFNADGNSSYSAELRAVTTAPPLQPPVPPVLQTVAISESRIDLLWNDVANETTYEIERKLGSGNWGPLASVGANVTSYSNSGLQPSTLYFYRIRALNAAGASALSPEVSTSTQAPPLQRPTTPALLATALSHSRISLAWTDVTDESGYTLERMEGTEWVSFPVLGPGSTAYIDENLRPATDYHYRIRAFNTAGSSDYSAPASATTAPAPLNPPAAPLLQAHTISVSRIGLEWNNVANEAGYILERKSGSEANWVELTRPALDVSSYINEGLSASTEYFFRIRAFNADGESASSAEVSARTLDRVPEPPAAPILAATAASLTSVALSWNEVPGASSYKLEQQAGSSGAWTEIMIASLGTTSFLNTGLLPSTEYRYRLRAFNSDGASEYSSEAAATTFAPAVQPPAAPALTGEVLSSSSISLRWNELPDETGYILERRAGAEGSWVQIAAPAANSAAFSDTSLAAATEYSYRLRAYNAGGNSDWSAELSLTTPAPVAQPDSSAVFVKVDSATSGLWPSAYGAEGWILPTLPWNLPFSILGAFSGRNPLLWDAASTDQRALVSPNALTERLGSAFPGASIDFDFDISGPRPARFAFYFLDWDRKNRTEQITIRDAATGIILDQRAISDFAEGKYVVYELRGRVQAAITATSGPDALLSGILIGGPLAAPVSNKPLTLGISAGSGELKIHLTGDSGQKFTIQSSTDFENWTERAAAILLTSPTELTLPLNPGETRLFLRALNAP
ncbi:MAG TPA: fibronectin type III domain-containing protein [Verrucomicrobiae bacterium]|nr:fibronectin type III domain-containing protein [Verrucomicrobiae bacterium]